MILLPVAASEKSHIGFGGIHQVTGQPLEGPLVARDTNNLQDDTAAVLPAADSLPFYMAAPTLTVRQDDDPPFHSTYLDARAHLPSCTSSLLQRNIPPLYTGRLHSSSQLLDGAIQPAVQVQVPTSQEQQALGRRPSSLQIHKVAREQLASHGWHYLRSQETPLAAHEVLPQSSHDSSSTSRVDHHVLASAARAQLPVDYVSNVCGDFVFMSQRESTLSPRGEDGGSLANIGISHSTFLAEQIPVLAPRGDEGTLAGSHAHSNL